MAFTLVIKTNASQATDVTINDLGVIVPNSGGSITFTEAKEAEASQNSVDLRDFLTDDAYGAGSSTLILNDGSADIDQADALNFLDTIELPGGDEDYGVVTTNEDGNIETNLSFDGTATLSDVLLGNDLDTNGNEVVGLPATPSGPTAAASAAYVDALALESRAWKEILLVSDQLDSTNDALSQAIPFFLDGNAANSDTFTITDGTTTETFTFLNTTSVAFDVQIGASADDTMTNLVSQINTDSTLWSAVLASDLDDINDGSGTSTSGNVVVIYRTNQSSSSFDDRIYGSFSTASDAVYVNFNGESDYEISTNTQLPSADPGQKEFGIGDATSDLITGQTHLVRSGDEIYTWDSDGDQWNLTGSGLDYGLVGDIQPLGSAAAAGVSNRVARADHVHTHGDRGGDGSASQHDADQIDVEGSYTNIGSPSDAETAFSNIDAALGGAKAGRLIPFGADKKVPGSGTRFLGFAGGPLSSAVGVRMLRAGTITGASLEVDTSEASKVYDLSIRLNGTEVETLTLSATTTGNEDTTFSTSYVAGDLISVAMVRTSGSGSSSFDDIVALVEVVDD